MRWIYLFSVAVILAAFGFMHAERKAEAAMVEVRAEPPEELPDYPSACAALESKRKKLARQYAQGTPIDRAEILAEARQVLEGALFADLAPHWMGTPWAFHGTSQKPGEGKIACGYFVSTLLRDAGFEVERVRLARQASGNIILSLTERENVRRLVGEPYGVFLTELKDKGPGVFVIGLDYHVGFIVQTESGARFVHADGAENKCVVSEPVETAPVLRRSRWREFANISADDDVIEKWLRGEAFPTRTGQ